MPATVGFSKSARRGTSTSNASRMRDDKARGEERMAAQVEEAVVRTDALRAQERREEARDKLLFGRAGRSSRGPTGHLGCRQPFSVNLPVRGQREIGEDYPRGGQHVVGEVRASASRSAAVSSDGSNSEAAGTT